jgi:hypothetical protein
MRHSVCAVHLSFSLPSTLWSHLASVFCSVGYLYVAVSAAASSFMDLGLFIDWRSIFRRALVNFCGTVFCFVGDFWRLIFCQTLGDLLLRQRFAIFCSEVNFLYQALGLRQLFLTSFIRV